MTVTLEVTCPNECFEFILTGPSRKHVLDYALKHEHPDDAEPCPGCGEATQRRWHSDGDTDRVCKRCGESVESEPYELWLFHICRSCALEAVA